MIIYQRFRFIAYIKQNKNKSNIRLTSTPYFHTMGDYLSNLMGVTYDYWKQCYDQYRN